MTTGFSDLSVRLTRALPKDVKKNEGIFFTPPAVVRSAVERVLPYMKNGIRVLEPSCGSCEFVREVANRMPSATITGIENNRVIFDDIKHLGVGGISLVCEDFMKWSSPTKYDLIVGNPPYFVMKKDEVDPSYFKYFEGRPNIFLIFIIKCLGLLEPDGILSFVLPTSFLNCLYYQKVRDHIYTNYEIMDISKCSEGYIETKQDTVVFTLRNARADNSKFAFSGAFGTADNIQVLRTLCDGTTTLAKMGFGVYVGKVVWNQHKDKLTDDSSKTLLIYSSDIANGALVPKSYSNPAKKNYIDKPGNRSKVLVLNRGYGVGAYKFDYCLIDGTKEYLVENHLICVQGDEDMYPQIMRSFDDDRTALFIQTYFGNSAMNTSEIKNILPIFV